MGDVRAEHDSFYENIFSPFHFLKRYHYGPSGPLGVLVSPRIHYGTQNTIDFTHDGCERGAAGLLVPSPGHENEVWLFSPLDVPRPPGPADFTADARHLVVIPMYPKRNP